MKDAAKTKAQLIGELETLRRRNQELEAAAQDAQSQRELREQYEWLQTILSSIGDGVIVTDAQGHITFMNAVAEALTGWTHQDAAGNDLSAVFRLVDAISGEPVESPFRRVIHEGGVVGLNSQTLLITRAGTTVPIDDSGAPLRDERGTIRGVVLIFRDITERQHAEGELRHSRDQLDAILRGVDDGITVQAPDGHLIYANDTAAQLCGYPSAEALMAAPVAEVVRQFQVMDEVGNPLPLTDLPGRLALGGQRVSGTLLRFRAHGSGEEHWSIVKATPVFDERGRVVFVINMFQDITTIKRAEAERERLLEQLTDERTLLEAVLQQLPAGVVITAAPSGGSSSATPRPSRSSAIPSPRPPISPTTCATPASSPTISRRKATWSCCTQSVPAPQSPTSRSNSCAATARAAPCWSARPRCATSRGARSPA